MALGTVTCRDQWCPGLPGCSEKASSPLGLGPVGRGHPAPKDSVHSFQLRKGESLCHLQAGRSALFPGVRRALWSWACALHGAAHHAGEEAGPLAWPPLCTVQVEAGFSSIANCKQVPHLFTFPEGADGYFFYPCILSGSQLPHSLAYACTCLGLPLGCGRF